MLLLTLREVEKQPWYQGKDCMVAEKMAFGVRMAWVLIHTMRLCDTNSAQNLRSLTEYSLFLTLVKSKWAV